MPSAKTLSNPWYYLENFEFVCAWIIQRYDDLLMPHERAFLSDFKALPQSSRGLMARMVMRKADLFRRSKLRYAEIDDMDRAMRPLCELGWVERDPPLTIHELSGLITKTELYGIFGVSLKSAGLSVARKSQQLDFLAPLFPDARPLSIVPTARNDGSEAVSEAGWVDAGSDQGAKNVHALADDRVYKLNVRPLCDRFRLMFFGNLRQEWSEFVLAELGLYAYETVDFPPGSRAFPTRQVIDQYLELQACKQRFVQCVESGTTHGSAPDMEAILNTVPDGAYNNDWLEARRDKLLFQIGRHCERLQDWPAALRSYERSGHPDARARTVRALERAGRPACALNLAQAAMQAPATDAEQQQLARMLPRLQRRAGPEFAVGPTKGASIRRAWLRAAPERLDLILPLTDASMRVEHQVRDHIALSQAPVFYVENALFNSMFGLLCWDAIFAAIPGAFFHPFQQGPADLTHAGFRVRREERFSSLLKQLDNGEYRRTILRNFTAKAGLQSPFVAWGVISEALMALALDCIPPTHLRKAFERILQDVRANRSGLPDLIQFWPHEQRYRMIEVKGPGDRLQDNQIRWLRYCAAHNMPVAVCHVQRPIAA